MFHKISEVLEAIRRKRYRNEGASLIMVIIMVSFVGILVSVAVYSSYYNFFMKYGDRSAKDNFYTVESALNEINVGLQRELSDAMSEAYMYANKRSGLTVVQKEDLFRKELYNSFWNKIRYKAAGSSASTGQYRVDKLTLYLDKTRYDTATGVGAIILTKQAQATLDYDPATSEKMVLKNVSLQYTDRRGYVSMLSTDIVVNMPKISFVANKEMPDLENYSLIANVRLDTEPSTRTIIDGSVYGGGKDGMYSENHSELQFVGANRKVIAKQVVAGNAADPERSITTMPGNQLWTEAIDVNSACISLQDSTYVRDDLTIDGKGSHVILAGQYYGYGNGSANAADSSSILINGARTTLDMSQLRNLMLLGHAFVGATHYDADTAEESDYLETVTTTPTGAHANKDDFMLGQSIAAKSDQQMYMVPKECMGYHGNVQELPKNPLTLEENTRFTASDDYKVVDLSKVFSKLGKPINTYGADYRPVYRRVNGSILVYYYLYFTSETMANKFFYDYYTADKEAVDEYIKEYVADFRWNEALGRKDSSGTVVAPLHIAGNIVYFNDAGETVLRQDTKAEDTVNVTAISQSTDLIIDNYNALYAKLVTNINSVADTELGKTAYENLVKQGADFNQLVAPNSTMWFGNTSPGLAEEEKIKALVVNNDGGATLVIDNAKAKNLYFVVASGDVRVLADEFNGVIIAGGNITIAPTCRHLNANPDKVKKALACHRLDGADGSGNQDADPNSPKAADILIDGDSYINFSSVPEDSGTGTSTEYEYISIEDLIHYENWSKE
ncbi:MAG: hypothetical protein HDR22_00545 [Lachnospiraceae bacterium]|nr:hypothetical protein [Lachnospiraceae bacterium]